MNKEMHLKLLELYRKGGYAHKEIAEQLSIPVYSATAFYTYNQHSHNLPKPLGFNTRKGQGFIKCVHEAYALYQTGASLELVGKKFGGVSRERVRQVFEKLDLKTRPIGKRRIYFSCENGHLLEKGEYVHTCKKCQVLKKKFKEAGLHLKTHCKYGHSMQGHNVLKFKYATGAMGRKCRICAHAQAEKHRLSKK